MTLNPDVVRARCGDIEDALSRLARFAAMPVNEFVADRDAVDAASYRLLVGIEAALSLCYHVSAKHLRQVPEQYAACFTTLRARRRPAGRSANGIGSHGSGRISQNGKVYGFWEPARDTSGA